ncbi:MAG: hypothetical protein IJ129_06290 [Ruminococcus sp.]|nr:hypothetical protein [Ruminococcus sp.]
MNLNKDKLKVIDRDLIKYIAIIPMAVGHYFSYLEDAGKLADKPLWIIILQQLALFAPPVFFFFIADGHRYTHSHRKYALRLLIFALMTQIPFTLANRGTLMTKYFFLNWNIIFTLFLSLIALMIWDSGMKLPARIAAVAALDTVTFLLTSEWMIFGMLIVLGLHIFREKPGIRLIWFTVCSFALVFISIGLTLTSAAFLLGMLSLMLGYFVMSSCCSGKNGSHPKFSKWFFYIFYPMHLLVIYVLVR